VVICLEQGADLHMVRLIPLPLTVSCSSKIQIGFTFLVPAHPGSPGQRVVKCVCVCVCVKALIYQRMLQINNIPYLRFDPPADHVHVTELNTEKNLIVLHNPK